MSQQDFVPLYVRIQRYLLDEIAAGRLTEGDRTPSEPELASKFATTRATVAKAFQQLVYEEVIVRRAGSGTFVARRALSAPIDLTRVRSFEEQLADRGAVIDYEVVAFESDEPTPIEIQALHLQEKEKVFRLDRLRVVSGERMSLERRVIPGELGSRMTPIMVRTKSIHRILGEDFRLPVLRVEGSIRAGIAKGAIADQLAVKRGAPVLIRDYVLLSADRRPLVRGESFYREDFHIKYVVQQNTRDR